MPVTAEPREGKPKPGRAWLAAPLGLLALLLLAGLALAVRPVSLAAGGHVLLTYWHRSGPGTFHVLSHTRCAPPSGLHFTTTGSDGLPYRIDGAVHYLWIDALGRQCEVRWFKGDRVKRGRRPGGIPAGAAGK